MEAAEAAAVAASLDEAEVARKMLMWGAQEGALQATRAEATRASGAVVAAPGNANIGDILEHKRRVWRLLRDEVTTLARGLEDVRAKAVMKTGLERVADNPFERVADPAKFSTLQAQQTGTEREVEMLKEALKMQQRTINKLTKQVEALRDERDGIEEGAGSPSRSLVSRSAAPSVAGTDSPSSVRSSVRSSAAASTKASLRSLAMPKAPAPPPVPPSRAAPRRPASAAASSRTSSGGSSPAASERSAPQKSEDLREQIRAARLAAARSTTVAAGRASPRTSSPLVPR